MYYRYNFKDLEKANKVRQKHGYYTMENLKKYVPLTSFENYENNWADNTWFVYKGDSCMSCNPMECKDRNEAYENLLESENTSLYETWNDL